MKNRKRLNEIKPELIKQWHPSKNGMLTPDEVGIHSDNKIWWKCNVEDDHEWQQLIYSRILSKTKCPFCEGKKVCKSNNLAKIRPELAKLWNYEKNGTIRPTDVKPNCYRKYWWKCKRGHETHSAPSSRKDWCSVCMNYGSSFPEQAIYYYAKILFKNVENRKKIFGEEVDIFIPGYNIGIEYDSSYFHNRSGKHEKEIMKDGILKSNSIDLYRVRDSSLPVLLESQIVEIADDKSMHEIEKSVKKLFSILIKKYKLKAQNFVINFELDTLDIVSGFQIKEKKKSLGKRYPLLSKEWNNEKNKDVTPFDVMPGSKYNFWWKCGRGHEWSARINNRVNGSGCPYCTSQKINEENSLFATNPELCKEWCIEKNGSLTPKDVFPKSNKKVWWKCKRGHSFESSIVKRTNLKRGCPYCVNQKVNDTNCLAEIRPDLSLEWHKEKNGELTPFDVVPGSGKKIWWKCEKGHEWKSSIVSRYIRNTKCPECADSSKRNQSITKNSILMREWDYKKNKNISVQTITLGSKKYAWWRCERGHSWKAKIDSRNKGRGCPYCSNKRVCLDNCLLTTNPDIAKEWHPTKNGDFSPKDVVRGSHKKIWWKCEKGHEWETEVRSRITSSCPYCSNKKVCMDNCLSTTNPDIAKEWHPTKNELLTPYSVTIGSSKKVWWICEKGHEWLTQIKVRKKCGCPKC